MAIVALLAPVMGAFGAVSAPAGSLVAILIGADVDFDVPGQVARQ